MSIVAISSFCDQARCQDSGQRCKTVRAVTHPGSLEYHIFVDTITPTELILEHNVRKDGVVTLLFTTRGRECMRGCMSLCDDCTSNHSNGADSIITDSNQRSGADIIVIRLAVASPVSPGHIFCFNLLKMMLIRVSLSAKKCETR